MPIGLVVMHWDERVGVEIVGAYPDEAQIQEKTLMQLYSQHEFTGDAGLVTLMAGATNLASYYTGKEAAVYVILILSSDEDGDVYEEGLAETARQVLSNLDAKALKAILPSLFQRLSVYPTLNDEQRLAILFDNDVKRMILKRLREEVSVSKSEISIWLKDQYKEGFIDTENLVSSLVKIGLLKISSVKGVNSDVAFLVQDILAIRRPPINILSNPTDRHLPESLKQTYTGEVRRYFGAYKPSEDDSRAVINKVILNPQTYEVIKLMREAVVTRNDLEKLKKKGVDDVDGTLRSLWDQKMIAVFQDEKGTEYYCLINDFFISKVYPKYLVDLLREQYRNKSQNTNTILKALDLLREEYYAMSKAQKTDVKEKTQEKGKEKAESSA